MSKTFFTLLSIILVSTKVLNAQVHEDKLGAWYMYVFSKQCDDSPWGFQGDIQHRNFDLGGDLDQLMLRGGICLKPKNVNTKFTLGYGNITSGTYGSSSKTITEHRIYQEALIPVMLSRKIHLKHRFRYEQRFVENQSFRTRLRYGLFVTIPLKGIELSPKTWYFSLYNELFINGEKKAGDDRFEYFDRNRAYIALGHCISNKLKAQFGLMRQTNNSFGKNQLQFSLHHNW